MTRQERRERDRAQRRQVIVNAARELAEAEGWESVTTRRLADCIEYSQPVLYSHFESMEAIVAAVAVEGFAMLATDLDRARAGGGTPEESLRALTHAYVSFGHTHPALYDAMFTLATTLPFAQAHGPAPLHQGFAVLRQTLEPLARDRDPDVLAELTWSALHGIVTLSRSGRLRPDLDDARLTMLTDLILGPPKRSARRRATG
jgi:AcrR family transcriptional regulator